MTYILLMSLPGSSEWTFILLVLILGVFYFFNRKGSKEIKKEDSINYKNKSLVDQEKIDIPITCPHCKNPNINKIRECEWCGNKLS